MLKKILNFISKRLTNNHHDVPLLWINFDYSKYETEGADGSCMCYIHPEIQNDPELIKKVCAIVDYIRDHYDMKNLVEI